MFIRGAVAASASCLLLLVPGERTQKQAGFPVSLPVESGMFPGRERLPLGISARNAPDVSPGSERIALVSANTQSVLDRPVQPDPDGVRKVTFNNRAHAIIDMLLASEIPVIFEESDGAWVPERWIEEKSWTSMTVRRLLDLLVREDPRYEWRDTAEGIVIVRPISSWTDSNNELNRRVRDFTFPPPGDAAQRTGLLQALARAVFPDAARLAPSCAAPSHPGPVPSLALHDVTVLGVFEAAIKADGGIGLAVHRRSHAGPAAGRPASYRALSMRGLGKRGWGVGCAVLP